MVGNFIYYTIRCASVLFVSCVLAVSWINVYLGIMNASIQKYAIFFLVPAACLSLFLSGVLYPFFARRSSFSMSKVLFTLFGQLNVFLLLRYGVEFFGLNPFFVTLEILKKTPEAMTIANQYYSIAIPFTIVITIILYLLSGFVVEEK